MDFWKRRVLMVVVHTIHGPMTVVADFGQSNLGQSIFGQPIWPANFGQSIFGQN